MTKGGGLFPSQAKPRKDKGGLTMRGGQGGEEEGSRGAYQLPPSLSHLHDIKTFIISIPSFYASILES